MGTNHRSEWNGEHTIETGIFVHEGQEFAYLGAVITPEYAVGYPKHGVLTSWGGETLGSCRVVSSWPVRSCVGSRMYQIEATINGRTYTGRGLGDGMIWKGRAKRS